MSWFNVYLFVIIFSGVLATSQTLRNDDLKRDVVFFENQTITNINNITLNRNDIRRPRKKRSIINLYFTLACGIDCNPINYLNYGCYCGLDGSGIPVDGIDRCCQQHDRCYTDANCPWGFLYFAHYDWTCYNGQGYCGYKGEDSCSRRLCECDDVLVRCLRDYPCPRRKVSCNSRWFW